jgi:uracil-DNA glycosylase
MPPSPPSVPTADLAPLLDYLEDLGYGDLYVARPAAPSVAAAPQPRGGAARRETDRPRPAPPARPGERPAVPAAAREAGVAPPSQRSPAPASTERFDDTAPFDPTARTPTAWDHLATLEALAEVAAPCTRCALARGRRQVVFGSGDPHAELMFVGEGPGAEEDRQGLPFVGPAGELLTKIVEAIGLSRDRVYIANVVKCRPPGNRDPAPDEVAACRGFLERQIDLVAPSVIVCLGRVAAQTLLGSPLPLGKLRGRWHEVRGVPTRVTFHPAALLRNASWKRPTWEDMQLVRDRLAEARPAVTPPAPPSGAP